MKFDDIIVLLGEFGKYQKRLHLLVCLTVIFTAMQTYISVFTLAAPKHRCKIPSYSHDTYEVQSDWHNILINQSIPWTKEDGVWSLSSCNRYIRHNGTMLHNLAQHSNMSTESCNQWVYDTSKFTSTFITQMDLGCGNGLARANANVIFMGGLLVGALGIGVFADIFGRKMAMMMSILLHIGGGIGSAFAPNYAAYVAFRFIVGTGNNGIFISIYVIGMELVGPAKRVVACILIEFFWCIGLCTLDIAAYFVRRWNILQLVIAIPTPLFITYFWFISESPRWLLSAGKLEEADKIIQRCAKVNGLTIPEKVIDGSTVNECEKQSVRKLFSSKRLLIRTLIIFLNWCVVSMVYYGFGFYVGNIDGDIYVNFAINTTVETAAYILCLLALDRIGRRPLHAGAMIFGGLASLSTIFPVVYADNALMWITVVLANMGKFGISIAFAVIYIWSAELFPTVVRNSGMGSSSMISCIGGMLCPYISESSNLIRSDFGKILPLLVFGGLSVVAGVFSIFLPETKGKLLPESFEDALKFGQDDSEVSSKTKYVVRQLYKGSNSEDNSFQGNDNFTYKKDVF